LVFFVYTIQRIRDQIRLVRDASAPAPPEHPDGAAEEADPAEGEGVACAKASRPPPPTGDAKDP